MLGEARSKLSATLPEEPGAACNVDNIDTAKRVYTPKNRAGIPTQPSGLRTMRESKRQLRPTMTCWRAVTLKPRSGWPRTTDGAGTAHLHGNSSIRCPRHSYIISLTGSDRYLCQIPRG